MTRNQKTDVELLGEWIDTSVIADDIQDALKDKGIAFTLDRAKKVWLDLLASARLYEALKTQVEVTAEREGWDIVIPVSIREMHDIMAREYADEPEHIQRALASTTYEAFKFMKADRFLREIEDILKRRISRDEAEWFIDLAVSSAYEQPFPYKWEVPKEFV